MKYLRIILSISLISFLLIACKGKKKEKPADEKFFPVLSFIKSQVAHVDTSLYSIMKLTPRDSTGYDTVYYKREQFRELAADFLSLPDLTDPKFDDSYTEKRTFDTTLNRAIFSCEPNKPEKEEIQRQQVLIRPDAGDGDKITTIIIDYLVNNRDSSVQKRMYWEVDYSFQVTTIRQLPGKPETTITYKVVWGTDDIGEKVIEDEGVKEEKKEEKK